MSTISQLALKGHFEELKKQFTATGEKQNIPQHITALISRLIKMAEDFYEHDPESFAKDYKEDYSLMIKVLNNNGYSYKGHPDMIPADQLDLFPEKKPMQKAGVNQNQEQQKRNAG